MNFFKSVFSDEPESPPTSPKTEHQPEPDPNSPPPSLNPTDTGAVWSLGGLIKTITTKSESVIETYRRDLKEFGSGLKKEIEVAQGSLESVSHKIDELGTSVLKNTAQIINQSKDAILDADHESDLSVDKSGATSSGQQQQGLRYSRFDAQIRVIQGDAATFCEEPEDLEDYEKWKAGFVLENRDEIDSLVGENGALESVYKRVVPNIVDEETFWCRYYYRVCKLKQAEDLRANLVKRAISGEEEKLSWDVDDEEEEEEVEKGNERNVELKGGNLKGNEDLGMKDSVQISEVEGTNESKEMGSQESDQIVKSDEVKQTGVGKVEQTVEKEEERSVEGSMEEKISSGGGNVGGEKVELGKSEDETVSKSDEKAVSEGKGDNGGSCKDSEFSVVSSHQSMPEEDDLGWDEIEDLSSIDDKKVSHSESPNKVDLRKRLSAAAEEEEDLCWDIEEDDEPVKA